MYELTIHITLSSTVVVEEEKVSKSNVEVYAKVQAKVVVDINDDVVRFGEPTKAFGCTSLGCQISKYPC